MKKYLLSLCCLLSAGCFSAMADGGQYLHIQTSDGWKVLDLEKADRLTFTSSSMVVSDSDGNTVETYDRGNLSAMYVDEYPEVVGVESVSEEPEAAFLMQGSEATMLTDGRFEVYATDGKLLVGIEAKQGEKIDLGAMSGSVVILRSGSYTKKANLR